MENQRSDIVVVFPAGYKDRMDMFFESNPGMQSRIAHHIDFPDYTADELMLIAGKGCWPARTTTSRRTRSPPSGSCWPRA